MPGESFIDFSQLYFAKMALYINHVAKEFSDFRMIQNKVKRQEYYKYIHVLMSELDTESAIIMTKDISTF